MIFVRYRTKRQTHSENLLKINGSAGPEAAGFYNKSGETKHLAAFLLACVVAQLEA
jgi:hypothetical protein